MSSLGNGFFGTFVKEKFTKGQEVEIILQATKHKAQIIDITNQSFYKMYLVKFEDDSTAWLNSYMLSNKLN